MCGIVGWVSWGRPPDLSIIDKMNTRLTHRGPDAGSIYTHGPMAFGHRRLSIIDLHAHANQPMKTQCERFVIVFNGEIYNFKDIKIELEHLGSRFKTYSDTEVVLEAFKAWGYECLLRLEGMFSFAIWDSGKQELFLARDRLGEKPLYYAEIDNNEIIFASELQALRSNPHISSEIDLNAFSQYLTLNYTSGDLSLIKGVTKLLPGHFLTYSQYSAAKLHSYWNLADSFNDKKISLNKEDAARKLESLLNESVKARMFSDVPIGAFLSGGIDSSSVVASMILESKSNLVNTFCIGFNDDGYSEANEAKKIATFLKTNHHELIVGEKINLDFKKIILSMDEPVADTSFIPFYYLAEFAHQSVKVALSGDGGDELLAGYETYSADKLKQIFSWVPKTAWDISGHIVNEFLPVSHAKVSFDYKLKQFIKGQKLNSDQAHLFWRTIFNEPEKLELVNPEISNLMVATNPFEYHFLKLAEVPNAHYLDRAMYLDLKTWLPDDILTKVDRATMAHSLESRAPFLDRKIVEFCAKLPVNYKMSNFNKKYLLKRSQKNILPKKTINQRKKGFNSPLSKWMLLDLKDIMFDAITNNNMSQYFKTDAVLKLWDDHEKLKADNSYKLFGLTCFSLWLNGS